MNVLSLFDGISCGQLALQRANIPYDNYFASEVDKYAISITQKHFPKTVQLGDVIRWADWNLPTIDLLIGGSPCQGFSSSGIGLNFSDPRSVLFFKFVDCLKWFKPKYFLLENVRMKKEWRDVISSYLEVEPILINSALVSAQSRPRLYWTNIPNISQPEDKHIYLKDVIEHGTAEKEKSYCIDANYFKLGTTKHHGSKPFQQLRQSERHMIVKESTEQEKIISPITIGRMVGRRLDKNGVRKDHSNNPITQRIELRVDDKSGCLTTVQKDNLVIKKVNDPILLHNIYGGFEEKNPRIFVDKSPTIRTSAGGGHIPSVVTGATIRNQHTPHGREEQLNIRKDEKSNCVVPSYPARLNGVIDVTYRPLLPIECERLQTLPDNYTEGLSNSQRYKCIGNGWTIDVITHIFRFIPNEL